MTTPDSFIPEHPVASPAWQAGFVPSAVDVSETRVESELRRSDRTTDAFLAMLAHELRNPLAPMHNALHIMRLAADDASAVEQARGTIERQLQHLTRVVDDLIDVSRVTRNTLRLRRERVDLGSVIHQALETCGPQFDAMQHEVEIALSPTPLVVHGDPLRLSQVLTILLSNAAKYTRPHGRIWVTVERRGSDAVMCVGDTGVGIDPDDLPHIFDLFASAHGLPQSPQPGLGIGLTLARGLTELHGGRIDAFSEGFDCGSEFRVQLPLVIEMESGPAPDLSLLPELSHRPVCRRILVVDDNVDAADSLADLLALIGHETHTAHGGAQALEAVDRLRPEVMLLDIGMPGMSGHDVARAIRRLPWGADVLLIALTGWGQDEDRARSHAAGFDHHLVKPLDLPRLEELLDEIPGPARRSSV